ncbi:MAG TPA: histidine kinase [Anaerolineales bacterium]|nr:histidine kinase [Anaerolineales bacterium]
MTRHVNAQSDLARIKPGGITAEGVIVDALQDSPLFLQDGDLITGANGYSIEKWAGSLLGEPADRIPGSSGDIIRYTVIRRNQEIIVEVPLGAYPIGNIFFQTWGTIVFALIFQIVATFIFIRRPENPAGRVLFLAASCVTSSTAWSFGLSVQDLMDGVGFWLFKICTLFFYNLFWTALLHFALLFPSPLPGFKRGIVPVLYGVPFLLLGLYLLIIRQYSTGLLDWFSKWTVGEGVHSAIFLTLTITVLVRQYRLNQTGVTNQQIQWLFLAALITGGGGLLLYILPGALGMEQISPNFLGLIIIPFPVTLGIAILRHNLFDIHTILNRSLVYGALTTITIGLYVFVVGKLGDLIQANDRTLLAFFATGLVAVTFQPIRDWLQRSINRLMYGERDDPVAVLSKLGEHLEHTGDPESALTGIVETIAQTLKLPYVAIELGQEMGIAAAYGIPTHPILHLPLVFQSEPVGALIVAHRSLEEAFSPQDRHLLENLAYQAGAAAHNVRLTADLRRSRQNLVTTREEERRRIRRDLHDGLGPQLASQTLTLDAIEKLIDGEPEKAKALLKDLKAQSQDAITDIRRLIYELRPPALDDLGLVAALRQEWERSTAGDTAPDRLHITLAVPVPFPLLPAAVELAAYRIVQEAVNNVIKHAQATSSTVCLEMQRQQLYIEISDNGRGLPAGVRSGIGLQSMRERAEELGGRLEVGTYEQGGTRVRAWLPIQAER